MLFGDDYSNEGESFLKRLGKGFQDWFINSVSGRFMFEVVRMAGAVLLMFAAMTIIGELLSLLLKAVNIIIQQRLHNHF